MGAPAGLAAILALPNELLAHVFTYLDQEAPTSWLFDQPAAQMFDTPPCDLKEASLVSWHWRFVARPLLFRHIIWRVNDLSVPLRRGARVVIELESFLSFLRNEDLAHFVDTFTLVSGLDMMDAPGISIVIYREDNNWLWRLIFAVIDPLRFTLAVPPRLLAALLSESIRLADAWTFDMPRHILSLSRPRREPVADDGVGSNETGVDAKDDRDDKPPAQAQGRQSRCELFTMRPWRACLLNEGSFISAYRTYEYFLRISPSILPALVGHDFQFVEPNSLPRDPLMPRSILDFSYVAVFPFASHVAQFARRMPEGKCRFYCQLLPRRGNDILDNASKMRNVDLADLWMEAGMSYRNVCRHLFLDHPDREELQSLNVFEIGDLEADGSLSVMVEGYLPGPMYEWKLEGKGGRFFRSPPQMRAATS